MNWGKSIVLVIAAFIAYILYFVFSSLGEEVELVSKDYYQQELMHQDKIDRIQRAHELSEKLTWERSANKVLFHFPKDFEGKKITGTINFYCPSNSKFDLLKHFDGELRQEIDISSLNKSLYKMQINWTVEGLSYYREETIVIP